MKKQVLLLFAALLFSQAAFAYDFSAVAPSGQTLYYNIHSWSTLEVVPPSTYGGWGSSDIRPTGNLVIPDSVTYNGTTYQVTSIGNSAFNRCSGLTSVTIPNSVTSIGYSAFCYCLGLTSVTIPNSVTRIEEHAFGNCRELTSVTIGNSVTSIGEEAFDYCQGLTAVHYNGTIGQWCGITFCNGRSNPLVHAHHLYINNAEVTSASIPNTITQIKPYTFYCCSGLTSVTIPNSVTSIGNYAFFGCSGLTSVTIPNSVTRIWNSAFFGCSGLTSLVVASGNTTYDSRNNCNAIIETYSNSLIYGCQTTTIPNSVISIGNSAFRSCLELTSVTIPNSVTSIGYEAFWNCTHLTSITFLGSTPPQSGGAFDGVPSNIPVYIPCGRLAYYVSQIPYFTNYIEQLYAFSAASADESRGTVQVLTEPSCTNPNAVLNAVPANGYRFDHWSTGSTDNPYILTITSDTTIICYFVANGTQGIGEVGEDDIHISVSNGHINVEGVVDEEVRVYDITGRMVQNYSLPSGVYIVKIGTLPEQKVVVMR